MAPSSGPPGQQRVRGRVTLACATCGNSFNVEHHRAGTAKFCSRACQGLSRRSPEVPCPACAKPVRLKPSDPDRRFCSIACRDAGRRVDVSCRQCGKTFSQKASEAADRLFCSRSCMQTAWGCARCAKLIPAARRDAGHQHCSDRCALGDLLDEEAARTGLRRGYCHVCRQVLDEDAFTRDKTTRSGLASRCKDCARAKYEGNKDAYRLRRYRYACPGGQIIPFTAEQKAQRFAMWGGRCWKCGIADASEEDHVKPVSKGGTHCLANLRPICQKCNTAKRDLWPLTAAWTFTGYWHPAPEPGSDVERRRPREPRVDWTCPQCNGTRSVRAHVARDRTFCSKACADAARHRPPLTLTCEGCTKTFEVPDQKWARTRRFCSYTCAKPHLGRRRRSAPVGQLALFDD